MDARSWELGERFAQSFIFLVSILKSCRTLNSMEQTLNKQRSRHPQNICAEYVVITGKHGSKQWAWRS